VRVVVIGKSLATSLITPARKGKGMKIELALLVIAAATLAVEIIKLLMKK
jgi:hypothetical protein